MRLASLGGPQAFQRLEHLLGVRELAEGDHRALEALGALLAQLESLVEGQDQLGRVVLTERLPIPELPLPGFASPLRRGAELAGAPTLVTVFSATSPESRLVLERLERAKQSFDQAGLRLVPLTIDPPDERAGARALLEEHGLGEHAGYVDERSRLSIEVLLSGLFGATRSTPLPTSFLLDRKGRIAVVYLGRVRPAWLRADATILLTEAEDVTHGGALGGGYWLFPLKRSYGKMLRAFEMLGERDQADVYRELRRDG